MAYANLGNSLLHEQREALMNIRQEFFNVEKKLNKAIKETENCYIISKKRIAVQNEIGGINVKDAFPK